MSDNSVGRTPEFHGEGRGFEQVRITFLMPEPPTPTALSALVLIICSVYSVGITTPRDLFGQV